MTLPPVRYLNVQPYEDKFLITDPYGVSQPIVASQPLLVVMSLLDGKRSAEEVKEEFAKRTGMVLKDDILQSIINDLDKNLLLLNDNFFNALEGLRREILSKGIRPPSHAGETYPSEGKALEEFIKESLTEGDKETLAGILVPHMDLRVALSTYGKTYSRVGNDPDLVVILGVSHYVHETPFSACPLDLDTPIGVLHTDKEVFDKLQRQFDYDLTHDILSYRQEHSIEFQTIFVKHLFPRAKALAVIVSYGDEESLRDIARKIAHAIEGRDALIVSSVDMSHVGKKFGDPASYDPSPRDREYIDLLSQLDSVSAFRLLQSDNNRTRIDGQFTNFVFLELLKLMGASEGKEIDYQIYHEDMTDSKVSYAGMVFT